MHIGLLLQNTRFEQAQQIIIKTCFRWKEEGHHLLINLKSYSIGLSLIRPTKKYLVSGLNQNCWIDWNSATLF